MIFLKIDLKILQKSRDKEVKIIEEKNLLNLKNDIVFQELFGNQKNSKITGHLLSLILEKDINNINCRL